MVVEPKQETKPQPIVALNEEQHNDPGNEQQKNKKVVDYVKQPFVKSVITFVSIAATFLGAIILFPYVFYFEKKMDIGVYMVLEDIESIIFANYTTILVLFYTSIILMLVPLIVGLRKINVLVSNLFVIASILVIGLLLDNLLGYSYVYLFLGYSLLYIIIGIIILRNYLGNLRHYGMMLIIIGIVNSLSQTSYYWTDEIIGYYVLFVFGRSVLFIWCTWWFLTRKEPKNHETI